MKQINYVVVDVGSHAHDSQLALSLEEPLGYKSLWGSPFYRFTHENVAFLTLNSQVLWDCQGIDYGSILYSLKFVFAGP